MQAASWNTGFFRKTGAYLELVRFPNLFTAMADVLAGCLIVTWPQAGWGEFLLLAITASAAFYGAGCVLNDYFDRNLDARERPSRPIPSGRVGAGEALALACFLFAFGLACASASGGRTFRTALVLVFLVIAYDGLTRRLDFIGPLNMASCRAANLLLGMSAVPFSREQMVFPVISLIYVFSLTVLSRFEVRGGLGKKAAVVLGGLAAVALIFLSLVLNGGISPEAFLFLGLLAFSSGPPLAAAITNPTPGAVGRAVKFLVLGIPLLDAAYVAGAHGWPLGLPVALCILPALFFARRFQVT